MKRALVAFLICAVVAAMVVAALGGVGRDAEAVRLVLDSMAGEVAIERDGASTPAAEGLELGVNDAIVTGAGASADLSFGRGSTVRLGAGTSARVRTVSQDGVHLDLANGSIEAVVKPGSGALRVGAGEREVVADDAAFRMAVREDRLTVDVSAGEALISGVAGEDRVQAGERLRASGGAATVGTIPDSLLLSVEWPGSQRTRADAVTVRGVAVAGTQVRIDGGIRAVEVEAGEDGSFTAVVPIDEGPQVLRLEARDDLGDVQREEHGVERDTTGPSFQAGERPR